jgi:hypothetical protein
MSTWLTGVIGQGIAANIGAMGMGGSQQHYQQQAVNQQMAATGPTGFGQGGFGQMYHPTKYMIDGKAMTFEEFINTLYPEDCAEKTMLILRLKKEN